jgi:hypothetical protein
VTIESSDDSLLFAIENSDDSLLFFFASYAEYRRTSTRIASDDLDDLDTDDQRYIDADDTLSVFDVYIDVWRIDQ